MNDLSTYRKLMIAAGILSALTILLSPAFQQETRKVITEIKSKADPSGEKKHYVNVSPDAMTTSQAVQVEPVNPFVVQEIIIESEQPEATPVPNVALPASVLKTLLKSALSPQAP